MPRLAAFLLALLTALPAAAQIDCTNGMSPIERDAGSRMSTQDFIKDVVTNEQVLSKAYAAYGYRMEIAVQTLDGDKVDGEYRRTSVVGFDTEGQRRETVIDGPLNTLQRITIRDHDFDGLREAFTLTAAKVAENDVVYSGRQRVGDIHAALFDLLPRNQSADVRGFEGRAWVATRDDAIIHTCGRTSASPIAPLRYDVTRAPVDDKYWFPVLVRADEDAHLGRDTVHVRVTVKYSDYRAR